MVSRKAFRSRRRVGARRRENRITDQLSRSMGSPGRSSTCNCVAFSAVLRGRGVARSRQYQPDLFPARFLRCRPASFYGRRDTEIFKLFACLQRRCKPSRPQPASRPRFRWIFRITIFRSNCAARAASCPFAARTIRSKAIQFAELILNGPAFLDHLGIKGGSDLVFELRQLVDRH